MPTRVTAYINDDVTDRELESVYDCFTGEVLTVKVEKLTQPDYDQFAQLIFFEANE